MLYQVISTLHIRWQNELENVDPHLSPSTCHASMVGQPSSISLVDTEPAKDCKWVLYPSNQTDSQTVNCKVSHVRARREVVGRLDRVPQVCAQLAQRQTGH